MHELGVVFHVIKMVEDVVEENQLQEVSKVTLEIGEVSGIVHDCLYDAWKWSVAKRSCHMKESTLEIETIPGVTYCEDCGRRYRTIEHGKICPYCSSEKTYLIQGNEFNIKEIEAC